MSSAKKTFQRELERLYRHYNHPRFVDPDPLLIPLSYSEPRDIEVAGLIAASLAFGRARQIVQSAWRVMECLGAPRQGLDTLSAGELRRRLGGFRHRYIGSEEMVDLLTGMQDVLRRYGSLGACMADAVRYGETMVVPALIRFVGQLRRRARLPRNYLLPDPSQGSACKRLCMFLRWMLRKDAVDPGPWNGLSPLLTPDKLVVPLDTHMHRISTLLGFTRRRTPNLAMALEVTEAFKVLVPRDPLRYDFALTRLGIRNELSPSLFHAVHLLREEANSSGKRAR